MAHSVRTRNIHVVEAGASLALTCVGFPAPTARASPGCDVTFAVPSGLNSLFKLVGRTGFEPVTFSVSGKIIGILSWAEEPFRPNYQQLCRWMSLAEALCGWQLAPRMAPVLAIMDP